jgi:hypothetical protein
MKKFSQIFESAEDKQTVEDVFSGLEMCKSIEKVDIRRQFQDGYYYRVCLSFSKECLRKRKYDNYSFSTEEVNDYWQDIVDAMNILEGYGFVCRISYYAANGVEMIIHVYKETIQTQ